MSKGGRTRISLGIRIFLLVAPLSLVFMVLFAVLGYIILSNNTVNANYENVSSIVILLVVTVIVLSLLLGLVIWRLTKRLLAFSTHRIITDMQQLSDGGKLSFVARKSKKGDPIGLLYEYYAKFIGVTGALLSEISDISRKRKEGKMDERLDESRYKGDYFGAAQNVNTMIDLGAHQSRIKFI